MIVKALFDGNGTKQRNKGNKGEPAHKESTRPLHMFHTHTPHLEVVEVAVALDVVPDEAHLQRRLRVLHYGRRHHHGGHGLLGLVVQLHPAHDTAPPGHLLPYSTML